MVDIKEPSKTEKNLATGIVIIVLAVLIACAVPVLALGAAFLGMIVRLFTRW